MELNDVIDANEPETPTQDSYERYIEPYSLPHCINLANMCQVNSAKNILEVGCSTGELSLFLLKSLTHDCHLTSIDIS